METFQRIIDYNQWYGNQVIWLKFWLYLGLIDVWGEKREQNVANPNLDSCTKQAGIGVKSPLPALWFYCAIVIRWKLRWKPAIFRKIIYQLYIKCLPLEK